MNYSIGELAGHLGLHLDAFGSFPDRIASHGDDTRLFEA